MTQGSPGKKENFFVRLVRASVILSALDHFTARVYDLLKNGLFGWIFTGYRERPRFALGAAVRNSKTARLLGELRYGICRRIESSVILNGIRWFMRYLLGCRLKVWGVFFAAFGAYSAIAAGVSAILDPARSVRIDFSSMIPTGAAILAALPLILSKSTLSEGITGSVTGRLILKFTGFTAEDVKNTVGDGGHSNAAFLVGVICGVLSHTVPPLYMLFGFFGLVAVYLVFVRPELGVLAMFALVPWLPTMVLAGLVILTALAYFVKLFRQKRVLRFEPIDCVAAAFIAAVALGGVISYSSTSLKRGLLMACLMGGYFLTVNLLSSREWLARAATAFVLTASAEAAWGVFCAVRGVGYTSEAWIDSEMFGFIGNRAVSTLENPNMLAEYLLLVIPIAAVMLIGRGEGLRRIPALFCLGVLGVCLVFTWSRGAWLGLIAALLCLLFMWHRRSIWAVIAGLFALPAASAFIPASVLSRFTSIGNMADSSTSYRLSIWRASVHMIRDNWFSGIGIGEGAWFRLYPAYAYAGAETAPHSHNLFLQIWLELGVVGIVLFALFIFLLLQAMFTVFRSLSGDTPLRNPDLSGSMLDFSLRSGSPGRQTAMRRGKTQLRLSTAGPVCGLIGALVQGMTDYSWYNNHLVLMFWLTAGLAMAYVRSAREQLDTVPRSAAPDAADAFAVIRRPKREKKNGKKGT